jgi:hypothetical protein
MADLAIELQVMLPALIGDFFSWTIAAFFFYAIYEFHLNYEERYSIYGLCCRDETSKDLSCIQRICSGSYSISAPIIYLSTSLTMTEALEY